MWELSDSSMPHLGAQALLNWQGELRASTGYLEFGGGGSTVAAHRLVVGPIVSIESDPSFIEAIAQVPIVRQALIAGQSRLIYGDIGPVREWGYPLNLEVDSWYYYGLKPLLSVAPEVLDQIDVVMIDGRFRVACALTAWSLCPNLKRVIVDDWERETYRVLEEVFKVMDIAREESGGSKETATLRPRGEWKPGALTLLRNVFMHPE